ncbi:MULTISPECIES: hypothetical protein [Dysgonomonas]|nr:MULTISPECIES: hypothetical protein [Dysgonomonas]MBF0650833.1 hypothetical protein [Dysgonomonas sp. GY75]
MNRQGLSVIMIRISIDREMKQFYSKTDVGGELWAAKNNLAKGHEHTPVR